MAKSVLKKKKTNRRLKKSVRRTLGALCMITAIIVAAIPFPDAAADPIEGGVAATSLEEELPYSYDVKEGYAADGGDFIAITDTTNGFDLSKVYKNDPASQDQIDMAHTISAGGGAWELDWQYKYFKNASGVCLITEYNDLYPQDTITLDANVYSNYINIPQEQYEAILGDTDKVEVQLYAGDEPLANAKYTIDALGKKYTMEGNPFIKPEEVTTETGYKVGCMDTPGYQFIRDNFRTEFDKYCEDYTTYLENLQKEDGKIYNPPLSITKTNGDRYADPLQFVCNEIFKESTVPLKLEIVYKKVYDTDGKSLLRTEQVRVPRLLSNTEDGKSVVEVGAKAFRVDANGFLAQDYASLVGVASGAFTDIQKVKTLEMSDRVYIIADSAFEHSFLESITLSRDSKIGNRAFYNCPSLKTVNMPETGITAIGTEAFALTVIDSINIPATVTQIGPGAFSDCKYLKTVNFVGTSSSSNREIGDYAFYNCTALNEVNFGDAGISKIGKCAFALKDTPTGNLQTMNLPNDIADGNNIGEYLFGRRVNLQNVTMPKNLNMNKLPVNMFYDCVGLANVTFPEESQGIKYDPTMFENVMNEKFYVRGPKTTYSGGIPGPRESTWTAYFMEEPTKYVPYVYNEDGKDFYEVNIGSYICVIDESGEIVSCKKATGATPNTVFSIPSSVGERTVTGIKEGALGTAEDSDSVIKTMTELIVPDGCEIANLGDNVFKGAPALKKVTLGDSVQTIGASTFANCGELESVQIGSGVTAIGPSAFENCDDLIEISFDNPAGGAASFPLANIGESAFSTKSPELTIYGLIDGSYGPFEWAMQPGNYMNPSNGLRVCYKSAKEDPQRMTVILDNSNNLPTLIDYPKYTDQEIQDIVNSTEAITPDQAALVNATKNIVVPSGVKSIDTRGYFSSSSKDINNEKPVYSSNDKNIETYFNGTKPGTNNIELENQDGLFVGADKATVGATVPQKIEDIYESPSSFSGLTNDTDDLTNYDKIDAGNDHIESIVLTSVEYLPENAFFSCERLETVDLGSAMKEMDALPFLGCDSLTSMACTSGNFSCNNGILYENLEDGTKKIVECLPGRGDVVGSTTVSVANDPDLASVSEIADEAFSYCPNINKMILDGASKIKKIPEKCFVGSEGLNEVDLPENVKMIQEDAFSTGGDYLEVIVRGREVALVDPSFQGVKSAYLITYEDAAIRESAREQGVNVETTLDEMLEVKFYMPDGSTLIDTQFIEMNGNAKKMAPDAEELREQGYITADQDLYGWSGQMDITQITDNCFYLAKIGLKNGIDTNGDGIPDAPFPDDEGTGDDPNGGTGGGTGGNGGTGGSGSGGSGDGGNGGSGGGSGSGDSSSPSKYTLTVVYGDGSGVYASGTKVIISAIEPPAGKEFYKWTTTNTGVTITSATSAATTVKTTNSDAVVTATYRDKSSVSSNTVNRKPIGSSGSTVQITKPGISNTDKAYASVSGSTDNFIIKITESTEAANAVATALSNKYYDMNPIKYFAMDISLYDKNGNKVTNTNGLSVNVTMPIPDALVQYGGNNKVGAVVNGNVLEDLSCKFTTVDGIPCVTFTATHFSPYTIYVDTSNLSVNTLDSTPKTGDGIHPKWFVSIALACISLILFMKRDKVVAPRKITV